ncbi:MAG: NAD(P)/FAD-dependent oxidoreductase [Gammaproteobacteria bacterium]|nr:NAD(P)/FAD-dependent oxidoreductase [Gammaproteobacteria bacterium]
MTTAEHPKVWPVAIVGGGPVGLCAALNLARHGVECLVLERDTAAPTDLRASTFHPPTLDMLESLDLTDAILSDGLKAPEWQVRMHETHEAAVFNLDVIKQDTRHPYRVQYEQADFSALALQRASTEPQIELRQGHEVSGVEQQNETVRLQLKSGDDVGSATASYVIAADGASSTLRRELQLKFAGLTYPETTILATTTFPFEAHLPGLSWVNYVWTVDGTFSLLRVPNRWRVSLYPAEGESIDAALRPERIEQRLQQIVRNRNGYDVLEARPYRIHQRILDHYRVGRIVFAGDAAHLNSPSGGMGMNCGIHDAFNLTDKLVQVLAGESPELLDRYDRQRRPVAREEILKQADSNRRRMQQRDPQLRRAELHRLQEIAANPESAREFLLRSSMITGLRQAEAIE